MTEQEGWIGVDLDGTLAEYYGWRRVDYIGPPIPLMMARVKKWISEGKRVKIFTARICDPKALPHIIHWLEGHGLGDLEVTNIKDYGMVELWDDRCVCIEPNTGKILGRDRRQI